ncbi:MAG: M20 family metallopeptidase [bacterium]|nr:M20 family metallopeptidase [bacterium]
MSNCEFKQLAESIKDDVILWRRHFHKFPELSNQEFKTSEKIQEILKNFGVGFRKAAGTGIIAEIKGVNRAVIGLRADIDALPVQEETGLDFASQNPGVMHACGHDAHIAIALGVAGIFSKLKNIPFTLRIIFQPAEESVPCGAPRMIKEGALKDMKCLIGFHVWAGLDVGKFSVIKGPVMASADRFRIVIKGKGGHGSSPHTAIDPIVASSYFITELQTIVSRKNDPREPLVVSIGKISGGDAFNIIPEQVEMLGTVRTFDKKQNIHAQKWVRNLLKAIEDGFGVKTYLDYEGFVPVTYNNPHLSERISAIISDAFGKKAVKKDEKPSMGSEDFSFYSQIIPCCYIYIGCGKTEFFHHSSRFTIDEKCLGFGVEALAEILLKIGLNRKEV